MHPRWLGFCLSLFFSLRLLYSKARSHGCITKEETVLETIEAFACGRLCGPDRHLCHVRCSVHLANPELSHGFIANIYDATRMDSKAV